MSFHDNYEEWVALADVENCPVCNDHPMPQGMQDLAELPHSWLNAEPIECIKGACHVTAKYHGIELFDLEGDQLLGLMSDVARCASALKKVTGAIKINYEIHGNTLPHLHVHLYPRHMDDPFPNKPIDYHQKTPEIYADGEYEQFVKRMRDELHTLYAGEAVFR